LGGAPQFAAPPGSRPTAPSRRSIDGAARREGERIAHLRWIWSGAAGQPAIKRRRSRCVHRDAIVDFDGRFGDRDRYRSMRRR